MTLLHFDVFWRDHGAADGMRDLGKSAGIAEQGIDNLKAGAVAAGTTIGAALGTGIAANLDVTAASDKLAAQLGLSADQQARVAKVSASVYRDAWGDSTATVNAAIKGVYQNIGNVGVADGGLERLTTKALALAETFEQDIGMSTAAAGQLIRTGLAKNADEAFDIITAGLQSNANKADDLLETYNEYGTQFRKLGLDGKTATGLLSQGLTAGARDADVVADSLKEFSIRSLEDLHTVGSDGKKALTPLGEAFKALGVDGPKAQQALAKGGKPAVKALDSVLDSLRKVKDPVKRNALAVQLFGTQAEDLGEALFALDPSSASQALGKVGGAADRMAKQVGDNPKAAIERFKRAAVQNLSEIAGRVIQWGMEHQSAVMPALGSLGAVVGLYAAVKAGQAAWTAATVAAGVVMKAWQGAVKVATGVQWLWNAAMSANPIGLVILAVAGLVAGIIVLYKKSETARKIIDGAFRWIKNAAVGVWNWIKGNWPLLLSILTGPVGIAVGIVRKNFDRIKDKGRDVLAWFKALPGRIVKAVGNLGSLLWDAGKNLIGGLIGGIRSKVDDLLGEVAGLAGKVREFFPFSPAKRGPLRAHPMDKAGKNMVGMLAGGMLAASPAVSSAASTVAGIAARAGQPGTARALAAGISAANPATAAGRAPVVLQVEGEEAIVQLLRRMVRVRGGDVQSVLGRA